MVIAALVAIYIKLVSNGSVLFKQERVGLGGKTFTCYKFRSMFVNSETTIHQNHIKKLMESDSPMIKIDNKGDSRLIPGAKFLRSTGLDELPQLWNVLKGDMSVVGPRPCIPYEYNQFEEWHKERFNTLPGITGLWQVNGKNRTTFRKMMELDVEYVRNLSPMLDFKIIINTLPAILKQVIYNTLNKPTLVNSELPATT
jgi:lipopolysaccharide/colanic/teichoic acid biosynthesis glycosyltransferase